MVTIIFHDASNIGLGQFGKNLNRAKNQKLTLITLAATNSWKTCKKNEAFHPVKCIRIVLSNQIEIPMLASHF